MDFQTLWQLVGFKLAADFEKKTWNITLGPVVLTGLTLPTLRELASDQSLIESFLSQGFNGREVLWLDYRRETPQYCIDSLDDLQSLCEQFASTLSKSKKKKDRTIATMCRALSDECSRASKLLRQGLEAEKDVICDLKAYELIPDALERLRKNTYPTSSFCAPCLIQTIPFGKFRKSA